MRWDLHAIELPMTLETALERMQETRAALMPVIRAGELVGVVTSDGLERFVAIHAALDRSEKDTLGRTARTAGDVMPAA